MLQPRGRLLGGAEREKEKALETATREQVGMETGSSKSPVALQEHLRLKIQGRGCPGLATRPEKGDVLRRPQDGRGRPTPPKDLAYIYLYIECSQFPQEISVTVPWDRQENQGSKKLGDVSQGHRAHV